MSTTEDRSGWIVAFAIGALAALAGLRYGLELVNPTEVSIGSGWLMILALTTLLAGGCAFLVVRILQITAERRRALAEALEEIPGARTVKR